VLCTIFKTLVPDRSPVGHSMSSVMFKMFDVSNKLAPYGTDGRLFTIESTFLLSSKSHDRKKWTNISIIRPDRI